MLGIGPNFPGAGKPPQSTPVLVLSMVAPISPWHEGGHQRDPRAAVTTGCDPPSRGARVGFRALNRGICLVPREMLWGLRANHGAARIYGTPEPAGRAAGGQVGSCKAPKWHQAPTFKHPKCAQGLDVGPGSWRWHQLLIPHEDHPAVNLPVHPQPSTDLCSQVSGKGQRCYNPSSTGEERGYTEMKRPSHVPGGLGCLRSATEHCTDSVCTLDTSSLLLQDRGTILLSQQQ